MSRHYTTEMKTEMGHTVMGHLVCTVSANFCWVKMIWGFGEDKFAIFMSSSICFYKTMNIGTL